MLKVKEKADADQLSQQSEFFITLKRFIFSFRPEEFIALVAFFPMAYLTLKAYFFFKSQGHVPKIFVGDMQRLAVVVVVIIIAYLIARYRSGWSFLRDALPFAYCLAIYTNLHDTVHFANPNDIHDSLIVIDQWLFGSQPCVWTQQFIQPWLTEIFSFCYMVFFLFAPLVALVLYLQKRRREFRETLVTIILCFYCGYILYIVFPAVTPRYTLAHMFTVSLNGTSIAEVTDKFVNILPGETRDAFPSLHTAVTLLTLMFAWKFTKLTFWLILPFCIGLFIATVYLRYHYFVDLVAGCVLAILVYFFIPKFDKWWQKNMETYSPKNRIIF